MSVWFKRIVLNWCILIKFCSMNWFLDIEKRRKNIYSVSVFLEYIYYINAFKMRV